MNIESETIPSEVRKYELKEKYEKKVVYNRLINQYLKRKEMKEIDPLLGSREYNVEGDTVIGLVDHIVRKSIADSNGF